MANGGRNTTAGGAGEAPSASVGGNAESRSKLKSARPYTGKITAKGGGIYTVEVDGSGQIIANCMCMTALMAGLTGYRVTTKYEIGDPVSVLYGNPSWIVASGSRDLPDLQNPDSRTHTAFAVPETLEELGEGRKHTPANDLVSGESEISNSLGMALVLATHFIALKAGDRAKIETCLLNEMVRIVSHTFKHHSALGDMEIYNDGGLNCVFNGTSYPYEAWGQKDPSTPLCSMKGNQVDMQEGDPFLDTGRWRFSSYIGWLGDFIHLFVTEPQQAVASIGQEGWRSGRFQCHVNNDGGLLVRSTNSIRFERVVRIQVPRQKKRWDDAEGNLPEEFGALDTQWLQIWKADVDKFHERAFQLRQFVRYHAAWHSLARFRQASKDWEVPKESEVPANTPGNHEPDVKAANEDIHILDTYACFAIHEDGTITIHGGDHCNVTMAKGSIYMSAPKNITVEAGADLRLIAGRNAIIKARRSVELLAIKGGITMFARTWWKGFCQKGSLWLRSDAEDPNKPGYTAPAVEEGDPEAEVLQHAVYIQTTRGKTALRSKQELRLQTSGEAYTEDPADTTAAVVIESTKHDVLLQAKRHATLTATGGEDSTVSLKSSGVTAVRAKKFLVRAAFVDFFRSLTFKDGVWNIGRLKGRRLEARSILGGRQGPIPPLGSTSRIPAHFNHVGQIPDDFEVQIATDEDIPEWSEILDQRHKPVPAIFTGGPPRWGFEKPSLYFVGDEDQTGTYETLSQQHLNLDTPDNYGSWNWAADQVTGDEIDSSRSKPWGATLRFWKHRGGDPLDEPSSTDPVQQVTNWTTSTLTFRFHQ